MYVGDKTAARGPNANFFSQRVRASVWYSCKPLEVMKYIHICVDVPGPGMYHIYIYIQRCITWALLVWSSLTIFGHTHPHTHTPQASCLAGMRGDADAFWRMAEAVWGSALWRGSSRHERSILRAREACYGRLRSRLELFNSTEMYSVSVDSVVTVLVSFLSPVVLEVLFHSICILSFYICIVILMTPCYADIFRRSHSI